MENQPTLFNLDELPQTDEPKKKQGEPENCLQDMLLELMNERKVTLAAIQRATEIPWGTLMDWHNGGVRTQKADRNLLKLAQFFNVSTDYLCWGIGEDSPFYGKFKEEEK